MTEYAIPKSIALEFSLCDGEVYTSPDYHPPIAGPNETWRGKSWRDMPAGDEILKRMNFFLFRRGLFEPASATDQKCIAKVFGGRAPKRAEVAA